MRIGLHFKNISLTRPLIPKGNLIEISYNELENDALKTLEKVYCELEVPNYENAKPYITEYLESNGNYKRNVFKKLDPEVVRKINDQWAFAFDEWNYNLSN